jgi:hypothetical protein
MAQAYFDEAAGPWVHSMSYGLSENLQGLVTGADSADYIQRTNVGKLGSSSSVEQ